MRLLYTAAAILTFVSPASASLVKVITHCGTWESADWCSYRWPPRTYAAEEVRAQATASLSPIDVNKFDFRADLEVIRRRDDYECAKWGCGNPSVDASALLTMSFFTAGPIRDGLILISLYPTLDGAAYLASMNLSVGPYSNTEPTYGVFPFTLGQTSTFSFAATLRGSTYIPPYGGLYERQKLVVTGHITVHEKTEFWWASPVAIQEAVVPEPGGLAGGGLLILLSMKLYSLARRRNWQV
jgi:hypothetical protein